MKWLAKTIILIITTFFVFQESGIVTTVVIMIMATYIGLLKNSALEYSKCLNEKIIDLYDYLKDVIEIQNIEISKKRKAKLEKIFKDHHSDNEIH